MSELTDHKRIALLMMRGWGDHRRSYNETLQILTDTFWVSKVSISKSTVHRTITRFEETGHVKKSISLVDRFLQQMQKSL